MAEKKLTAQQVRTWIPSRPLDTYKGHNGHVLVIAGSRRMSGAAVLAALGALRSGAGLVSVAMPAGIQSIITHRLPEVLSLPLPETSEGTINEHALSFLSAYLTERTISAVALGPGLSINDAVAQMVKGILKEWDIPLVLDADGLNNVHPGDLTDYPKLVITPHAIELERLLGMDRDTVKRDRAGVAAKVAREQNLVCVLKGYHTVITDGKTTFINPTGNPALATGGMGDVLTGILGGFLAQGIPVLDAACAAAYVHGLAGDLARVSDRGLLATEVADAVPQALRKIGVR